jgi:ribosomal protein S27E
VEAQSVEAQSVEAQSVEAQSVEAQTSGPWSRAKAARTGENLSASPSKIKCPDTTCVWPNSEDATTCIRCGRSLTQSQQEDIGEDRTVVEKQAMPAEAPNDDEIARPVDPRVVHERLKMLAAALNDGLPVEDEMRPKAPDPRSPAKAAPTGEARSPAPSKIKCPDPTCVWPNSEDATTCVRCGRSLSPQQQNSPDEDRLLEVLSLFSPEQRRALLNVLSLPDSERAAMIGEVHKRGGGSAADLLIDLEEDPIRRVKVLSMLKVLE